MVIVYHVTIDGNVNIIGAPEQVPVSTVVTRNVTEQAAAHGPVTSPLPITYSYAPPRFDATREGGGEAPPLGPGGGPGDSKLSIQFQIACPCVDAKQPNGLVPCFETNG